MLDRRQFTFAGLVALVSGSAAASDVQSIPEVGATSGPGAAAAIVPVYAPKRKGDELQIDLVLRNIGRAPVDVLLAIGSRPGPQLTVTLADGSVLEEIVEVGRRDMMSRIGPLPQFAPIAAGESTPAGTFRYRFPSSRPDAGFDVVAEVSTSDTVLTLPVQRLNTARAGT